MIVTTMNDLPGYRVTEVYGEVFGLTVRSRHIGSDIGASLKGLVGGEVKGYTKMLADSRLQAVERLREAAARRRRERGHRDALRLQRARQQHDRGRRLRHRGHRAARVTAPSRRRSRATRQTTFDEDACLEDVLWPLRKGGLSASLTHHPYHALDSHLSGYTLWQVGMPLSTRIVRQPTPREDESA